MSASQPTAAERALARQVVEHLGGRYSGELGIDLDAGAAEAERWFLAATLFGSPIPVSLAERTFHVLEGAGVTRVGRARELSWGDLVDLLDQGGYVRYDFRTATRLQSLADALEERHAGRVENIGCRFTTYPALCEALDALPGWGPVTIQLFLRELRGIWPGATPPLDERAAMAGTHLGLLPAGDGPSSLHQLERLARAAGTDRRDLESGLVRLALAHRGRMALCPGGTACVVLCPAAVHPPAPSATRPRGAAVRHG